MNRLIAIALLSSCGVADTSLLLTVPAPGAKDGGIDPGDIQISIPASFGRAPVGGVYRQPLRLSNSGSKVASVELVRVDGRSDVFGIDLGERRAIFPGNEMEVALVYVPIGGAEAATFVFNTCADAGSCIVERSVTGVGLDMAFRCEGGDVGRVRAGECLFADVACINDSDYSVFVDGVRWSGSPAFLPSSAPTAEVDSGESVFISVQFCPFEAGEHYATIDLFASVPEGRNLTSYEIQGEAFSENSLDCMPGTISIGPTPVGSVESAFASCRADQVVTIDRLELRPGNSGMIARLYVDGFEVGAPYTVAPGDLIDLEIAFAPMIPGDFRESLHIHTESGTVRIEIIATAVDSGRCEVRFSPTFDFGTVMRGASQTGNGNVDNLGTGDCTVETIGFAPGTDPAYSLLTMVPEVIVIGPGESAQIYGILFSPARSGLHSGYFTFAVQELSGQFQVELIGYGDGGNGGTYQVTTQPNAPLFPQNGTQLMFSNTDDGFTSVSIGFPFEFAGQQVSDAYVGTNGLISFASSNGLQSFINEQIPEAQDPNALIAWWWDDLHTDHPQGPPSLITTELAGSIGSRIRYFTFLNVAAFGNNTPIINAEVRLYETTNLIEVHYGAITERGVDFNGSVGWESFDGLDGFDPLGCSPDCNAAEWPTDTIITYQPTP